MKIKNSRNYHIDLFERLPLEVTGSYVNCYFVSCSGRKIGIPKFLLSRSCSNLCFVVNSMTPRQGPTFIFPEYSTECIEIFKELLVYGKVENVDMCLIDELKLFMMSLGIRWSLSLDNGDNGSFVVNPIVEKFSSQLPTVSKIDRTKCNLTELLLSDSYQLASEMCDKKCERKCTMLMWQWNAHEISEAKRKFEFKKGRGSDELRRILIDHLQAQKRVGILTVAFNINDTYFCAGFFARFFSLSLRTVRDVLRRFNNGEELYSHLNKGVFKSTSIQRSRAIGWIKCFSESYGQYSPEEKVTVLSHWLNKATLFKMYKAEVSTPCVSRSTFYSLFKTEFGPRRVDKSLPWIRISKYSTHSVCNICVALNNHHRRCKTEKEIQKVVEMKNAHRLAHGASRKKIEEITQSAISFPSDHLCLKIDGMDNKKSWIPRYLQKPKEQVQKERQRK